MNTLGLIFLFSSSVVFLVGYAFVCYVLVDTVSDLIKDNL